MASRNRAAIYHRVSSIDQNPKAALGELRAAAKRSGLRIALAVEEAGSGANNHRPGLARVMEAARRGRVDAVLVWKLDRFGRSALDLLTNLREFAGTGTRFVSITQGIDIRPGGDAMSRLLLTMLGAVAEFERDLIVERTKFGLEKGRQEGRQIGRPRVPRPQRAAVRALRDDGYTWSEVAGQLGCTVWAARQAVKKGGPKRCSRTPRK